MANRRNFLLGIGAALAAPAIVRAESLMKVARLRQTVSEATLLGVYLPSHQHTFTQVSKLVPCDGRILNRSSYVELYRQLWPGVVDGQAS